MSHITEDVHGSKQDLSEQWAFVRTLPEIAHKIHKNETRSTFAKRSVKFCFNGMRYREELQSLQDIFACSELSSVLENFPAVLEKPFYPYVCADWTLAKRLQEVKNHFLCVKNVLGEMSEEVYKPEGYKLFDFETNAGEIFSVDLFSGYKNEGSMGIRLCDSQGNEFYSLTFHLSDVSSRTLQIGALQGPNERIPERQSKIVMLTKSLFGLRPKSLMIEVLYRVAEGLNVSHIYGISNNYHIYQSDFYPDEKRLNMAFDGDSFWAEYQAEKDTEAFVKFPKSIARKDIASLKSSKRSLYRKRYAWLEEASVFTEEAMKYLIVPSEVEIVPEKLIRAA